jgi:hypothetical protein
MAQAKRAEHTAARLPAPAPRGRPRATGTAVEPEEKKRKPDKDPLAKAREKPDAGRTTRLGRKVESPASLRTAGPSGQRSRTVEQKKHTNK